MIYNANTKVIHASEPHKNCHPERFMDIIHISQAWADDLVETGARYCKNCFVQETYKIHGYQVGRMGYAR